MILDPKVAKIELAKRHFTDFVSYTKQDYEFNWHHVRICNALEDFANGKIRKLMLFVPPQHGKSQLCTRHFPPYVLGKRPTTKIAVCSYSATLAQSFNRDIQRIIDDTPYHEVFPNTTLSESNVTTNAQGNFLRNADIFETVGYRGFVKTVGVGGSLTGTPLDLGIIDDPFKDREEAMSIRIRDKVYSWFTDVFRTRMHNDSQELIINTRWDEDDLCGRILKIENDWKVLTFPAIKERDIVGDPRTIGEALWPERHSLERLEAIRATSPFTFSSLYQQEPKPSTEALVFPEWSEYEQDPDGEAMIGIDFGFSNDPTAIIQVKIVRNQMYLKELLYEKGLTNTPLDFRMNELGLKGKRIVADSADPKTIEELRIRGYNIVKAIKGPDSIVTGIAWIKDHQLFVHKNSHNLKNELLNYQWVMYGGKATNIPIASFNHLIDPTRYVKTLVRKNSGLTLMKHR